MYFLYNATSAAIVDNTIEQLGSENVGIAVEILFITVLETEISLSI